MRGTGRAPQALRDLARRRWAYRERRDRRRQALAFYGKFVSAGDLCFDVGANRGNRTSVFLDLGANVIAVEPQRDCVDALRAHHDKTGRFVAVECALGAEAGHAILMTTDADTLATLSPGWVERVREAGRFRLEWSGRREVRVSTLDCLIEEHGVPMFCKIDVEGYEEQVLEGLSQPLPALSFEFTPEFGESTVRCVDRLRDLGFDRFGLSLGESLELGPWLPGEDVLTALRELPRDGRTFGDVYALASSGTR